MKREGRANNETREIKFIKDYTKHALGSVLVQFGDTKVITTASVEEGKPKWMDKVKEKERKSLEELRKFKDLLVEV